MTKFSRLTLSAALLAAFALPAMAPAMAGVPAQHRAPAKVHGVRGPVRHIAATGPDAVRTPVVSSTPVAVPAMVPVVVPGVVPGAKPAASSAVVTPVAPKPATVVVAPTATVPTAVAPATSTTAAPAAMVKPVVKTN